MHTREQILVHQHDACEDLAQSREEKVAMRERAREREDTEAGKPTLLDFIAVVCRLLQRGLVGG